MIRNVNLPKKSTSIFFRGLRASHGKDHIIQLLTQLQCFDSYSITFQHYAYELVVGLYNGSFKSLIIIGRVDVNVCQFNPCHNGGTCVDQDGSFICVCTSGYRGDNMQRLKYRRPPFKLIQHDFCGRMSIV